jgi:hypothetical protein
MPAGKFSQRPTRRHLIDWTEQQRSRQAAMERAKNAAMTEDKPNTGISAMQSSKPDGDGDE